MRDTRLDPIRGRTIVVGSQPKLSRAALWGDIDEVDIHCNAIWMGRMKVSTVFVYWLPDSFFRKLSVGQQEPDFWVGADDVRNDTGRCLVAVDVGKQELCRVNSKKRT